MRKKSLHLAAYLFFCNLSLVAQQPAVTVKTDSAWFAAYFDRLNTMREYGQPSAYDSLELVRQIAERSNYQPAVSGYYFHKATWFLANKKTDAAIQSFRSAIAIAEKGRFAREGGNAYLGLANLYQFNGNTLDAAANYLQAVKLLKEEGRKRTLIGIYRNLYNVLSRLQQKNEALQNMLSAVITDKSSESDLVKIINTKSNEAQGLHFPDQSLIKEVGANMIYVIFGNAKFVIRDFRTLGSYGSVRDVQRIPPGTINQISDFPRNGSIVMELIAGDPKIYIIKDSLLYHIYSIEALEYYGGWDAAYFVPAGSLKNFPKSDVKVTIDNVNTVFDLKQEFDNLSDSIETELKENAILSNELSQKVASRNQTLQQRKSLLWVSVVGLVSLLLIVFLLLRNFRQKQRANRQVIMSLHAAEELSRQMAVEKERTRIASDIHDDLGAGLSTIRFLSEKVKLNASADAIRSDAEKIAGHSNDLVQKMNELIWAMNEKNDTLEDLLFYTRAYAADYCEENDLDIDIEIPPKIPGIVVNGEIRRNVFLSIKEGLHNIVKHANAKKINLQFMIDKELGILIKDDGYGFSEGGRSAGNGLRNMKMRMENVGGEFNMENAEGVIIRMKVPLPVSI
jgi:signal transduction histidine kinase